MSTSAVLTLGNTIAQAVVGEDASGPPIVIVQGQTGPLWTLAFFNQDNTVYAPGGVTGTVATLFDRQAVGGGTGLLCTGAGGSNGFTSLGSGVYTFGPAAVDVATPGEYVFEIELSLGFGIQALLRIPVLILPRYGT